MSDFGTVEQALEDLKNGKIIVVTDDPDRENEGDLICVAKFATQENVNFMAIPDIEGEMRFTGKIRYAHQGAACTVRKIDDNRIECIFDEPQRAATPGQALVLYDGDIVVGGGTIIKHA